MDEEDTSALDKSSNSETVDFLEVDDAESDDQDEVFDHENISLLDMHDNVPEPEIPPTVSEVGSGNNSVFLNLPQRNISSRSRHVWTTSKGRTLSIAAAISIVHVARGTTRGLRGIGDPLLLFGHFITNHK